MKYFDKFLRTFIVLGLLTATMVLSFGLRLNAQTTTRFNDGYLTVFKVTSGAALGNTGTAIVTEEYLPTGVSQSSPNYSVSLPTTGSSKVAVSGSAGSAGAMTRSENGRYLIIPGYNGTVGDANTWTVGAIRSLNASGTVGAGISGTFYTTANDFRGAASDDGTNFWTSGGSVGIKYTNDGSTITTVSSTSTNTRVVNIFNGQLFYSTGSGTNGIYKVGNGKPTTTGQTSTIQAASTAPYSFSISPDGLTIYAFGSANTIVRFTYSGTYDASTYTYSGGTWSSVSSGFTLTAATGVAVDWNGYAFSAGANGAMLYACNATTLVKGADNGTGAITTTILRTITGNNAFRGLAFSPAKQTISKGANTPVAGNITQGANNAVLFQFNLSADEGNSTIRKLILTQSGSATVGAGNSISNFRIVYDADGDGLASAGEISAAFTAAGTVSGSNITFSGLSQTYINEGSSNNYLIIGDVAASGTGTFIPSVVANKTINSTNYTTNLVNAGGSPVYIGGTAPAGNTLTIAAGAIPSLTPTPSTLSGFNYNVGTGPSSSQSFTLAGANLTAGGGTITINGSTNYEVSTTSSTTGFGTSATLTYTGTGTISSNTVWIRLKAGLSANTYNGETLAIAGGGATTSVTASGNVTTPTITPSGNVTGLSYSFGAGPSTGSTFTISASNLTAGGGNITFTSSANFEVSVTSATMGFVTTGNTVTLAYTGSGTFASNTVWVRLKAGLSATSYGPETISISGGGTSSSITASGSVSAAGITPFTAGNLVVVRLGDGTTALSTAATQTTLVEYTTAGTYVQSPTFQSSTTIPAGGSAPFLNMSGSTANEGFGTTATDGSFFGLPGYNVTNGTASVNGAASANLRSVGRANANGTLTIPVSNSPFGTANTIRGLASDGTNYWGTTSATGTNNGVALISGGTATSIFSVNGRCIQIFNGQLYFSSQSGSYIGVNPLGTGLPTTAATPGTLIAAPNADQFSFNPAHNILYVADEGTAANGGGIRKYTRTGTTWTFQYALANTGSVNIPCRGLTVDWSGTNPVIYATEATASANRIIKVTDDGTAQSTTNTGGAAPTVIVTAAANYRLAGLGFAPGTPTIILSGTTSVAPYANTADTYTAGSGPVAASASSFVVNGKYLTGNITITAPANFQVSTSATTGFAGSLGLTPSAGSVTNQTVYVRLISGLSATTYTGNVTITTAGCPQSGAVAYSGTVNVPTPAITSPATFPTALTGFTTTNPAASASQTFTLSANNLTSALTIMTSAPYEISTPSVNGGAYAASLNLGSTVSGLVISVRLKANTAAGTYTSGTIVTSTADAAIDNVTIASMSGTVYSGSFTVNNLAVEVIGDGVTTKSSSASQVNVWEFNTAGVIKNQFPFTPNATLPTSAPYNVTASANATSEGNLILSSDGTKLGIVGYNATIGTATIASTASTSNQRVVATLLENGTKATNAFNIFSLNNIRSVASNGYSYWVAGTPTGGAGFYYLFDLNSTPVSLGNVNTRVTKIFNKALYYSSAATGNIGIFQIGTNGLPIAAANTNVTKLTPSTYTGSPYGFAINPTDDIMYVADDGTYTTTSSQAGGIIKYTKVSGVWTYQYTMKVLGAGTLGARGIEVDWNGTNPVIYCTSGAGSNTSNDLVKITDIGAGSAGNGGTSLSAAGSLYVYRGVQFAPQNLAGGQLYCTATLLPFGGQPDNSVSPEKSFNVSGNLFSGNITVTAPYAANGYYGLSFTSGGPYASSLTIPGGAPANQVIYMVFQPDAAAPVGLYNGNLQISATGASTLNVPVTGQIINPVNYYNIAGGDITNPQNWSTDGTNAGTKPANFTDDGQYFNLASNHIALASSQTSAALSLQGTTINGQNYITFSAPPTVPSSPASFYVGAVITGSGIPAGATITSLNGSTIVISQNATASATVNLSVPVVSPWTIAGTLSKLIIGNGTNPLTFTIPVSYAYSGIVDVKDNGTLVLQNSNIPALGTLATNSTVNYNQSGAVNVPAATYGNLTLQGSSLDSRTLPSSNNITYALTVSGDFVGNNVTINAQAITTNNYMKLGGDLTLSNGAVMVSANPPGSTGLLNVVTSGSSAQTISYTGGGTVNLYALTLNNAAGLTLGNATILGIYTTLNCTTGILTTGTNKVVLNSTATLTETSTSYVLGNVETTRSLTTGSNTLGGLGLTISAGTAPGTTTVLRNTGTSNAVGCLAKSVKRTFTITNSGSGLNANLAYSFVPANELNGLIQTELELYNVTGNTVVPNSSISGNTISVAGLSSIAGTYTAAIAPPTITASATADPVCHAAGAQTTDLAYTATTGDIVSYSITWSGAAPAQGFTNVTDAAFITSPIVIAVPANAVANTYTGSLTVKNSSGCTSVSSPFTLLINPQLVPSVSIAITTGSNPTCQGGNVTFTATPVNGGTAPTYQWYKNGVAVTGNTTNTYTATNINTSTPVYVVMTVGTGICVTTTTATSSTTTLTTKDNSWTGAVSTTWGTPANWCSGSVPGVSTNIVIPTGLARYPVLNNTYAVHDIEIQSGATVSLNDQQLTISGIIEGTGKFKGTPNSKLVISTPGAIGTLYMDPAANTLGSLKQTTALSTLTLGNPVGITGELNVGNTTLNTGGNLTLRSNVNGTAWVAPITGSGSITGSVTVERYMPYYGHRAWMMLAVPTGGSQTINAAWQEGAASGTSNPNPGYGTLLTKAAANPAAGYDATTAGNSLLILNTGVPNATGSWAGVTTSLLTTPVATTSGYMVYMRGDRSAPVTGGPVAQGPVTLRTSGSLYQGTQTAVPVSGSNNTLIGNIYASAVDYKNLVKTGLAGNFKLWDPKLGTIGGYQTFTDLGAGNPASYTPSPGGGSYGSTPNTRIESGQAFIVQGGGGGGSIQFTEAARVSGSNNYVFRGQGSLSQYPGFKVNLEVSTASGFVLADGNSVYYNDAYSDAVNNDDATKVPNFGENFGILKDGHVSQVETRRTMDSIVYQMTNLQQQQYRLQFIASGFETGAVSATLVDNFLHTATPVSLRDTVSILFKVTTDAGSSEANRFKVVFKNSHPVTDMSIHAAGKATTVQVVWTVNNEHNTRSYEVEHSSNGIEFKTGGMVNAIANGSPVLTYNWLDENPVNGDNYYRVKAVSKSGESNYSSMVKVTIGKDKKGFAVYPNPVTGDRANIQFINQPAGRYTVNVINKAGQVLYTTVILHNGGTATQTVALSTAVTTGTYQVEVVNAVGEKNVQNMLISK